jgi:hypothetical protein
MSFLKLFYPLCQIKSLSNPHLLSGLGQVRLGEVLRLYPLENHLGAHRQVNSVGQG